MADLLSQKALGSILKIFHIGILKPLKSFQSLSVHVNRWTQGGKRSEALNKQDPEDNNNVLIAWWSCGEREPHMWSPSW